MNERKTVCLNGTPFEHIFNKTAYRIDGKSLFFVMPRETFFEPTS